MKASQIWIGPKDPVVRASPQDGEDGLGRRELRLQFWTGLNEYLVAEHPEVPKVEARPSWTLRLPSGVPRVGFELRFGLRQGTVGIDLWFWRATTRPIWDRIRTAPDAYDALISAKWSFELVDGREKVRMFLDLPAEQLRNDSTWPDLYTWFGEKLSLLYTHVAPRLREDFDRADTLPVAS